MTSMVADGRLEELQIYRLLQYVQERNKVQIERLVNMGVDDLINLTEPHEGKGVLHLASVANDTDMVEFLIGQGARPDVQDKRGRTPVMLAAELGHDGVVSLLAKKNADMKLIDVEGKGVLFYCVYPTKRHVRCLQVALNSMADVNNVSHAGVPLLMQACENALECEGMCLSLLERGADPNATNQVTGRTALMEAVKAGAVGLVRAILKRGANVNALDMRNFQAVHFAAVEGHFEIIRVLSAYAADMGGITEEGNTALHYAAHGGFANCCRFLAQRGCNPKLKNLEGLLPRQISKDLGHKASLKELKRAERLHGKFSKGSGGTNEPWALTLHDWSHEHESDLRKAFDSASDGIVGIEVVSRQTFVSVLRGLKAPVEDEHIQRILIAHDRRREGLINIIDFLKGLRYLPKIFVTASYEPRKKKRAAKAGKTKKTKLNLPLPICTVPPELLYRRDDGGPPHFMIENHHLITDSNRFDRDHPPGNPIEDDSAWYIDDPGKVYINISYCVKTGDIASLKLAFSQNVPVDVKDQYYKTPLMTACGSGNYEVAKFLLDLGADVNARDQFCWTPLHHACHAGRLDIIELLVEAGAAVDAPALSGATPLMRAIESCRPCCVDYLLKAGATVTAENKTEQNCLDIARAYADQRIMELIQAKINSLSKARDNKKDKAAKPQAKPRPLTPTSSNEKYLDSASSQQGASSATKTTAVKADSVILHSTQITSGALNKVDISFQPRTVWGKQLTTRQLMEKKEERRQRFSSEVDFEDFRMPFNKNLRKKTVDLADTFE